MPIQFSVPKIWCWREFSGFCCFSSIVLGEVAKLSLAIPYTPESFGFFSILLNSLQFSKDPTHYVFACAMPLNRMERHCSFDKISLVFQDPAHLSHPPRSLFLVIPSPLPSQREEPQPQPCVPNVPCTYHSLNHYSMAFSSCFLCLPSQLL